MVPPPMALTLLILELGLLTAACFALYRRWGNTPSESGAYALLLPLMAVSFGFETAFLMGAPYAVWIWELLLCSSAVAILILNRKVFSGLWRHIFRTIKIHPAAAIAVAITHILFLTQIFSAQPDQLEPYVQYTLNHPLTGEPNLPSGALPLLPGNSDTLSLWLVRFHGGIALGLPALMAFGAITFATYALARRYAWPPTAVTVTLLVISMPRLVCLVSAGSSEIIHAAVSLLCVLILYRLIERPYGRDLFLLLMSIGFAISFAQLKWLYPAILVPLSLILILRRHGRLFFTAIANRDNLLWMLTLIPTVLFIVYPLLARSAYSASTTGHTQSLVLNPDGIQGALANSFRYLLEAIHLTLPVDRLFKALVQSGPIDLLHWVYNSLLFPLLGRLGATEPFQIQWAPNVYQVWFGPFGFMAVIPALLYALIRGPRRLKAVALSLVGYFYMMTLIPAWQPGNAYFFTLLFTVGGFSAAFLLPPWRFSIRTKHFLQALSFVLLFYSLLFNPFGLLAHHLPVSF